MTKLVENGRLVGSPFAGIDYDLSRLTRTQATEVSDIMDKSRNGGRLGIADISKLMKAREAAKRPGTKAKANGGDTMERLTQSVRELREVFR